MRILQQLRFILMLSGLALGMVGCDGMGKSDGATNSQSSMTNPSGLASFQATVYPIVSQNCVQCHSGIQAPFFASSSVTTAYNSAKSVVNFASPSSSNLAIYAGNGHCGAAACSSSSLSVTMLNAITTWAAAENSSANPTPTSTPDGGSSLQTQSKAINYFTASVSIPTNLPGPGTTATTMQWNLSQLSPTSPFASGATFQLSIQQLTSGLYRISNPHVLLASGGIRILGIHVLIKPASQAGNGQESAEAMSWTTIDRNISTSYPFYGAHPVYGTALTGSGMELPVLSGQDALVIGFEKIGAVVANCQNMNGANGFESIVKPIFENTCLTCHNASSTITNNFYATLTGEQAFPMDNVSDTQLCAEALQFVNFGAPTESNLIVAPQSLIGSHPAVIFDPLPFTKWIQSEAAIGL